jgi:hypothetical protein
MNRAAFVVFVVLGCSAGACASGRSHPPVRAEQTWNAIGLGQIHDPALRQTVSDLLRFVDGDVLWPQFALGDDPIIIVDGRAPRDSIAYCIGLCVPKGPSGGGSSRVWLRESLRMLAANEANIAAPPSWGLAGDAEVLAVGFSSRELTVTIALHESFHLHYQTEYSQSFGDEVGGADSPWSSLSRRGLETTYSSSEPVVTELRSECRALVDALHAVDRDDGRASLRRFVAVRDERRSRPNAPVLEEDYWERQEGVPVNLERRTAKRLHFKDPSLIETALSENGCDVIPEISYLLVLGGLESAVLDAFDAPRAWPFRVYPRDGSAASSLYALVQNLSIQQGR